MSHGDKPGTGVAFAEDPEKPEGYVYVMDPSSPGDFSKSMRARMDHLVVAPKSVRFDVQFPGLPSSAMVVTFPNGRAGDTCTGQFGEDPEPIVFHRGPIPFGESSVNAASVKREKVIVWEGVPKKPNDPWGIRFRSVGDSVTEATLFIFDPAHPRDFDRAERCSATFELGAPSVRELNFSIQGRDGSVSHMHYSLDEESRKGDHVGYLGMMDMTHLGSARSELIVMTQR